MPRLAFIGIAGLIILSSCKSDPIEPTDFAFDYIPLEVGSTLEYDVDSIVYDAFQETKTTYQFIMRETVKEIYEDAAGRDVYRIERSMRWPDSSDFEVMGSYALVLDGLRLERTDDNKKTVPLVFPPTTGEQWDGEVFAPETNEDYRYDFVGKPATINGQEIDHCLRVIQRNDTDNLIIRFYGEEMYARGVGLVYSERLHLQRFFSVDSGLHWIQRLRP